MSFYTGDFVGIGILAHNRDDHAKNHAFMMDAAGAWRPTPAYDLTLSNGPAGEHNLAIAGEGRNPERSHILQVAKEIGVALNRANAICDEVKEATLRWRSFADEAGLSARRTDEIDAIINGRRPAPRRKRRSRNEPDPAGSWSP